MLTSPIVTIHEALHSVFMEGSPEVMNQDIRNNFMSFRKWPLDRTPKINDDKPPQPMITSLWETDLINLTNFKFLYNLRILGTLPSKIISL